LAKSLLELKTDLKSLKYQGVNGSQNPYVTKDINNPPAKSRLGQEFFSRVDDTVRVAKAILPTNSRFLENQAKLQQLGLSQKLNPFRDGLKNTAQSLIQTVKTTAVDTAKITASTLAQVPLAGTGTRLAIGFQRVNGSAALQGSTIPAPQQLSQGTNKDSSSRLRLITPKDFIDSQGILQLTPLEDLQESYNTVDQPYTQIVNRALNYQAKSGTTIQIGNLDSISRLKNQDKNLVSDINQSRFNQETGAVAEYDTYPFIEKDYRTGNPYRQFQLKEDKYQLGTQGLPGKPADVKTIRERAVDKLNAEYPLKAETNTIRTEPDDSSDLIKFNFRVVTPEEDVYLFFRAYLSSFSDDFQGNWSETSYIGRGEKMQTYDGFSRNISLSFKIAASTRTEMKPLYQKIVYLASTTAPTYGGGSFMRGTLVNLTVGDYLYNVPGVITSVNYKWETDYPWEIALEDDVEQLPHILDCSVSFRPIHGFIPQTGLQPYITNPTGNYLLKI
jgi:hypothetical protein